MLTITFFFVLIFLEAFYETNYDSGRKTLSGLIEAVLKAITMLSIFAWMAGIEFSQLWDPGINFIRLTAGYLLLRFAFFDIVYNLFRSDLILDIFYVGNTKLFDKLLRNFLRVTKFPVSIFLGMTKVLALIFSAEIIGVKFISISVALISLGTAFAITLLSWVIAIIKKLKK